MFFPQATHTDTWECKTGKKISWLRFSHFLHTTLIRTHTTVCLLASMSDYFVSEPVIVVVLRWQRTCLTTPNWTGWGTRPSCRRRTCSWRTSGCSAVRTSNGPWTLWRDTMQSHARYAWLQILFFSDASFLGWYQQQFSQHRCFFFKPLMFVLFWYYLLFCAKQTSHSPRYFWISTNFRKILKVPYSPHF